MATYRSFSAGYSVETKDSTPYLLYTVPSDCSQAKVMMLTSYITNNTTAQTGYGRIGIKKNGASSIVMLPTQANFSGISSSGNNVTLFDSMGLYLDPGDSIYCYSLYRYSSGENFYTGDYFVSGMLEYED